MEDPSLMQAQQAPRTVGRVQSAAPPIPEACPTFSQHSCFTFSSVSHTASTQPPRGKGADNNYRQFGTILSANNSPKPVGAGTAGGNNASGPPGPTLPRSSTKKKARIRKGASAAFASAVGGLAPLFSLGSKGEEKTYTVTFDGGPIGLQLEPVAPLPPSEKTRSSNGIANDYVRHDDGEHPKRYHCRVQRFADDGPDKPGQARKAERVRPGDYVLAVNGVDVSSYSQAIQLLRDNADRQRSMRFGRCNDKDVEAVADGLRDPSLDEKPRQQQSTKTNHNHVVKPGSLVVRRNVSPPTPDSSSGEEDYWNETSLDLSSTTPEISNCNNKNSTTRNNILPHAFHESTREERKREDPEAPLLPVEAAVTDEEDADSDGLLGTEFTLTAPNNASPSKARMERSTILDDDAQLNDSIVNLSLDGSPDSRQRRAQVSVVSPSEDKLSLAEVRSELRKERQQKEELLDRLQKLRSEYDDSQKLSHQEELESNRRQLEEQRLFLHRRETEVRLLREKGRESDSTIVCLRGEHRMLQTQLASAKSELRKYLEQQPLESQQPDPDSHAALLQQKTDELERVKEELASLKYTTASQAGVLRTENSKLREQVEHGRKELGTVRSSLAKESARLDDLEECKQRLQRELEHAQQQSEAASVESAALRDSIQDKNETIDSLEKQVENAKATESELRSRILSVEKTTSRDLSTNADEVSGLRAEVHRKENDIYDAAKTVNRLRRENEDLRNSAKEAKSEESGLRLLLKQARSELENVRNGDKTGLCDSLDYRAEKAERLLEEKTNRLKEARSQLDAANATIQRLSEELKQTNSSLSQANATVASLEKEQKEFILQEKRRNTELEGQVNVKFYEASVLAKAKLAEARTEISELHRQVRALESTKRSCKREIESLSQSNRDLLSQVDALQNAIDDKDNLLSAKTVECMTNINLLEDTRDELTQKSDELVLCRRALEAAQAQESVLSSRLSNLTKEWSKEKGSLTSEIHGLQEELVDAKARRNELERLLRTIRRNASESEARLSQARELLDRERQSTREVQQSAEATRVALLQKLETAVQQVDHFKLVSQKLEKERNSSNAEVDSIRGRLNSTCKELASLKRSLASTVADHKREMESALSDLSSQRDKSEELFQKLSATEARLCRKAEEMESEVRRYEDCLRVTRAEAESRAKKQDDLLLAKENELRALFQTQEELRTARHDYAVVEQSLRRSREETEHLAAQINDLTKDYSAKIDQIMTSHAREVERMSNEKKDLEQNLRKADERREDAEARLYAAEEGLIAASSERERIIDEKNRISSQLHKAEDTLSELRSELDAFKCQESFCSSDDGSDNELKGLTRSDLKAKCLSLQRELHSALTRAEDLSFTVGQRENQIGALESDLERLVDESRVSGNMVISFFAMT